MGEKQKLQMEIEEQRAAMQEIEMRETKMKQEAKLKDEEIKVKEFSVLRMRYNVRNVII